MDTDWKTFIKKMMQTPGSVQAEADAGKKPKKKVKDLGFLPENEKTKPAQQK